MRQIFLGLTDPLNLHLIKLAGFEFPPEQRGHFRREVRTWLDKNQRLRIRSRHRTGSSKFSYDLLFDYPFGGVERICRPAPTTPRRRRNTVPPSPTLAKRVAIIAATKGGVANPPHVRRNR